MLKLLAILAFWLVLTPATVAMSSAQAKPENAPKKRVATKGASKAGSENEYPKRPDSNSPSPPPGNKEAPATTSGDAAKAEQENLDIQRKLEWFTGGLVLVGLMQAFTMIWQASLLRGTLKTMDQQATDARSSSGAAASIAQQTLTAIERQAKHMEDQSRALVQSVAAAQESAKVAQRNLDAMMNRERARIRVEIVGLDLGESGFARVNFAVYCHGPTAAFISDARVLAEMGSSTEAPTGIPMFPMRIPPVLTDPKRDDHSYIWNVIGQSKNQVAQFNGGELIVHFWGLVRYKDVFGNDWETAFCHIYKATGRKNLGDDSQFMAWSRNGSPDRNRAT
jgi:hypothetical protein